MTLPNKLENLIQVKKMLAGKYARRADAANSRPLQKKLWNKATRYSRQAEVLENRRRQLG